LAEANTDWFIFVNQEASEVFAPAKKLIAQAATLTLIIIICLIFVTYIFATKFTVPIKKLCDAVLEIGKGNLDRKVDVKSGDEIEQLADSFNRMLDDLQRTVVSRDYVDNIVSSMADILVVVTPDGKIEKANRTALEVLGYNEEELIGKDVSLLFPEEERIPLKGTKLEKLIKEGTLRGYGINYKTKDGRKIPVLLSGAVMKDKNGNISNIVCVAKDITERKKAEEETKHISLLLCAIRNVNQIITKEKDRTKLIKRICDALVENLSFYNSWIVLFDGSGKFIEAAETGLGRDFMSLTERLKKGALTTCVQKALSQQDIVIIKNPLSECVDCPLSGMYSGRGGMVIRLECGGKIYGLLSVSTPNEFIENEQEQSLFKEVAGDIAFALYSIEAENERKKAEEKLRYFQKAVESSSDAIGMSTPEGRHYYQNEAFTKLFGLSVKEIDGTSGPPSTVYADEKVGREVFATIGKGGTWVGEVEMFDKDKHKLNISLRAYSVKDEKGKIIGLVGAHTDITDRKKAEVELQKAYDRLKETQTQLIHAEKMVAIGTLASGVAHEVKNPLGIIMLGINYFEEELPKTQKDNHKMLQVMKDSVKRADRVVGALLDFSRLGELSAKPEDINAIIESSLNLLQHKAKIGSIEIIKELGSDLPKALADRNKMEQVFVNLFLNAFQAMPKGGKLFIRTYKKQFSKIGSCAERREENHFRQEEAVIVIEVEDTGCGIAEADKKMVFDPFFTTKEIGEGTGLGLYITSGIIKLHEGIIELESSEGKGTKVTIILKKAG